jgi:hypothetical protein
VSPRVQNAGLVVLLLAIVGLVGSAVIGVGGRPSPAAAVQAASGPVAEPPADRIRVEVLNASGRPGLAKEVMRYLRDRGFDVVGFGNARPADGTATRVLARVRDSTAARTVADTLGIATVAAHVDTLLLLDASVVLGTDWKTPGSAPDSAASIDSARSAPPAVPERTPAAANAAGTSGRPDRPQP